MYSGTNMCHVTDAGNGCIVSKSLRKSTAAERRWAVSPDGDNVVDDRFRHKFRAHPRPPPGLLHRAHDILSAFGIDNADRIYTKGELMALKAGVKAF